MNFDDIVIHLAAGQFFGRDRTCLGKIRHETEDKAREHSDSLNRSYGYSKVEPYPCYWCSKLQENDEFYYHVGRAMTEEERDMFLKLGVYYAVFEEAR